MKSTRYILLCFYLVYAASAKGQIFDKNLFRQGDAISIPFEYINGFIIMDVAYGPNLPLKFVFDTGAEYSILTYKEYAKMAGVRFGRKVSVLGADLSTKIEATVIHDNKLELNHALKLHNLDMILLDEQFLDFGKYVGFPVHGILGSNVFSRFIIEINYRKGKIVFHNPQAGTSHLTGYQKIPVHFHSRKPYLDMDVMMPNGQSFTGTFLLDSGADLSLLLMLGSHKELNMPEQVIPAGIAAGLGGNMKGYMGRVQSIDLANVTLPSPVIHFQQVIDSLDIRHLSKNGIVGNRILSLYTVLIDYPNHQLYLKPRSRRKRKMRVDKSGMAVIASGPYLTHLTVSQVMPNTPAQQAGVQAGDQILKFGWWPASMFGIGGITKRLSRKKGKKIKLTILRKGKKIKISFRLDTYI